jgi:hypothetical protein
MRNQTRVEWGSLSGDGGCIAHAARRRGVGRCSENSPCGRGAGFRVITHDGSVEHASAGFRHTTTRRSNVCQFPPQGESEACLFFQTSG